jgi:glyoxylase-like metal-dependent hydrolase (beta-lactamase superfamily II)
MKLAFGERALPPAMRVPLDEEAQHYVDTLEVADYAPFYGMFEAAPTGRVRALPAGKLALFGDSGPTGVSIPIVAYMVECAGTRLVVDCGLGPRWRAADGGEAVPDDGPSPGMRYLPVLDGPSLADQVGDEAFHAQRLLCTHLHVDHAGDAAELKLPVEASRAEIEASRGPGYSRADLDGLEMAPIDLDPALPIGPFPASRQIADGVLAIDTSGHTAGSISIFLCIGAAWALICGDAVYPRLDEPTSPAYLGMLRIRRFFDDLDGVMVLAGHDTAALRACAGGTWLSSPRP